MIIILVFFYISWGIAPDATYCCCTWSQLRQMLVTSWRKSSPLRLVHQVHVHTDETLSTLLSASQHNTLDSLPSLQSHGSLSLSSDDLRTCYEDTQSTFSGESHQDTLRSVPSSSSLSYSGGTKNQPVESSRINRNVESLSAIHKAINVIAPDLRPQRKQLSWPHRQMSQSQEGFKNLPIGTILHL